MEFLKNKWALVTGASRGIGKQIALKLAEHGMNVVLHSRDVAHTVELEHRLKDLGVESFSVAANLSNLDEIQRMIEVVKEKVDISVLYNNAGIQTTYYDNYLTVNEEDYLLSYRVNLIAPMKLIEGFAPKMIENNFGRIVNVTSGIANQPEQAAYTASKGALDKLTKDLSSKFIDKNISLNVLDPGWIKTDLGGPNAHHEVETVYPGVLVSIINEKVINGQFIRAQDYNGMSLEDAVEKLNSEIDL